MSNRDSEIPPASTYRDFAELSIVTTSVLAFALIAIFLPFVALEKGGAITRDFVVYWATGQQLVHHGDPYDAAAMLRIEHTAGFREESGAFYMRNPPWALLLALPLGMGSIQMAALGWSLTLLGCQIVSGWLIWLMHGRPPTRIHWLAIWFAPSLICLLMGQTSLFALLGLVLFYRMHRSRPFIAGMSLWLCSLKPHLFLAFGMVLLVWLIVSRSYKIIAGAATALIASCIAVLVIDPAAWAGYSTMMHAPRIAREAIPCLSVAMRLSINPRAIWLQYLPSLLASCWGVVYYWRRRGTWDWIKDGNLLLLVSLVSAPYCWIYDQVLAIPALLQGAYATRLRPLLAFLAIGSGLIMIAVICGLKIYSSWFLWPAPVWLAWYLLATGLVNPFGKADSPSAFAGLDQMVGSSRAEKTTAGTR